jgi:CRP-like cAMP-binding protein
MQRRHFSAGETIFSEGDVSDEAYIIRVGRVEIVKQSAERPLRLTMLGEGDVFGEMGLLDERPRSATAQASEDVAADAVGRAEFMRLLRDEPDEAMWLLHALFERLRSMNRLLVEAVPVADSVQWTPRVRLLSLTEETGAVVPAEGIEISRFPFRIGRVPVSSEDRALAYNDIALHDREPYRISLNHCAIDLGAEGAVVRDRGSRQGTVVNDVKIGPLQPRDAAPLEPGENEVVMGQQGGSFAPKPSPFRFKVLVQAG